APAAWSRLLAGASRQALERLTLLLLEHAAARARAAAIQDDLDALARFYELEAVPLAQARAAIGYAPYPVPQLERDALFTTYRHTRAGPNRAGEVRPGASPERRAARAAGTGGR